MNKDLEERLRERYCVRVDAGIWYYTVPGELRIYAVNKSTGERYWIKELPAYRTAEQRSEDQGKLF